MRSLALCLRIARRARAALALSFALLATAAAHAAPPWPLVSVDGRTHGQTIVRPVGGSVTVTVRYEAWDNDWNLSGIRPNAWHPQSGWHQNNGGNWIPKTGAFGSVVWTVTLDKSGDWLFWTEARDQSGPPATSGLFRLVVIEGGAVPPVATVQVDGLPHGSIVVRPDNGSRSITIRFKATDANGDLARIRPQFWHQPSDTFLNDNGAWTACSGGSGEIVRTFQLNRNGDWYFWTDAEDAPGTFVNSGAWTDGLRITVLEDAPPPGDAVYIDVDGDGIRDEIVGHGPEFNYFVNDLWESCDGSWDVSLINQSFGAIPVDFRFYEHSQNIFSWMLSEIEYQNCDFYIDLDFQIRASAGAEYGIFHDVSGDDVVDLADWYPVAGGTYTDGWNTIDTGIWWLEDLGSSQFFLVRYGQQVGSIIARDPATGAVLGRFLPGGSVPSLPVPANGRFVLEAVDVLGKVIAGDMQPLWSVVQSATNLRHWSILPSIDLADLGRGQFTIGVRINDSTTISFTLSLSNPPPLDLDAYQPGRNATPEVLEYRSDLLPPMLPEQHETDPARLVLIVNDDNDHQQSIPPASGNPYPVDHAATSLKAYNVNDLTPEDDLVRLNVRPMDKPASGTLEISSSHAGFFRLFAEDENGVTSLVGLPMLPYDFASPNPSHPLHRAISTPQHEGKNLVFYLEGRVPASNVVVSLVRRNAQGAVVERDDVHMTIQASRHLDLITLLHNQLSQGDAMNRLNYLTQASTNLIRRDADGPAAEGDTAVPADFRISSLRTPNPAPDPSTWLDQPQMAASAELSMRNSILDRLIERGANVFFVNSIRNYENKILGGYARTGQKLMVVSWQHDATLPQPTVAHEWLHAFAGWHGHVSTVNNLMRENGGGHVNAVQRTLFLESPIGPPSP